MINLFLDLRNSNFDDNKKLNFKEFNINVVEDIIIYDFFSKCVTEIYECFTVNNNNFTNFKEFIYCPSI